MLARTSFTPPIQFLPHGPYRYFSSRLSLGPTEFHSKLKMGRIPLLLACATAILLLGVSAEAAPAKPAGKNASNKSKRPDKPLLKPIRLEATADPQDFSCNGQSIASYVRTSAPGADLDIVCVLHPAFFKADCRITSEPSAQTFETRVKCRAGGLVFKPELPVL